MNKKKINEIKLKEKVEASIIKKKKLADKTVNFFLIF